MHASELTRSSSKTSPDLLGRYMNAMGRTKVPSHARQCELAQIVYDAKRALWTAVLAAAWAEQALPTLARDLKIDLEDLNDEQILAALLEADIGADHAGQAVARFDNEENSAPRRAHAALVRARNTLARHNLRLVVKIASRFRGRGLPLEDLIQEGNIGLLRAADRYDPSRETAFSTYAALWIRHAVGRAVDRRSQLVRVPVHIRTLMRKAAKIRNRFATQKGRAPQAAELAAELGVEPAELKWAQEADAGRGVSLSTPISADGSRTLQDTLSVESPLLGEEMDKAAAVEVAAEALEHLSQMERDILRRRFALDGSERQSLRVIGEDYDLSRERIRQLQNRALAKLSKELSAAGVAPNTVAA